jgi:PIN domain nuclease of toxin-antitoxin system
VAALILLDTHVVAWLYAGAAERIPPRSRAAIDRAEALGISPMVQLELQYLYEIERVREPAEVALTSLERTVGLRVVDGSLDEVVRAALRLDWTRDPFDRLIAAHATVLDAPLATADEALRANLSLAMWN